MTVPVDSLQSGIRGTRFSRCYFQPTAVRSRGLVGSQFQECEFEHLELIEAGALAGTRFIDCRVRAVTPVGGDDPVFAPEIVALMLGNAGAEVVSRAGVVPSVEGAGEPDWALRQTGRLIRTFIRATELNEATISMKLGSQWAAFERSVLPRLLEVRILKEVPYLGHGVQRRFRLGVPLRELQAALEKCGGEFDRFVRAVGEGAT